MRKLPDYVKVVTGELEVHEKEGFYKTRRKRRSSAEVAAIHNKWLDKEADTLMQKRLIVDDYNAHPQKEVFEIEVDSKDGKVNILIDRVDIPVFIAHKWYVFNTNSNDHRYKTLATNISLPRLAADFPLMGNRYQHSRRYVTIPLSQIIMKFIKGQAVRFKNDNYLDFRRCNMVMKPRYAAYLCMNNLTHEQIYEEYKVPAPEKYQFLVDALKQEEQKGVTGGVLVTGCGKDEFGKILKDYSQLQKIIREYKEKNND